MRESWTSRFPHGSRRSAKQQLNAHFAPRIRTNTVSSAPVLGRHIMRDQGLLQIRTAGQQQGNTMRYVALAVVLLLAYIFRTVKSSILVGGGHFGRRRCNRLSSSPTVENACYPSHGDLSVQ